MTSLYDYFGRDVSIVDVDGKKWCGNVTAYTSAIDSETGAEEIAVRTSDGLIGFCLSDIEIIEER